MIRSKSRKLLISVVLALVLMLSVCAPALADEVRLNTVIKEGATTESVTLSYVDENSKVWSVASTDPSLPLTWVDAEGNVMPIPGGKGHVRIALAGIQLDETKLVEGQIYDMILPNYLKPILPEGETATPWKDLTIRRGGAQGQGRICYRENVHFLEFTFTELDGQKNIECGFVYDAIIDEAFRPETEFTVYWDVDQALTYNVQWDYDLDLEMSKTVEWVNDNDHANASGTADVAGDTPYNTVRVDMEIINKSESITHYNTSYDEYLAEDLAVVLRSAEDPYGFAVTLDGVALPCTRFNNGQVNFSTANTDEATVIFELHDLAYTTDGAERAILGEGMSDSAFTVHIKNPSGKKLVITYYAESFKSTAAQSTWNSAGELIDSMSPADPVSVGEYHFETESTVNYLLRSYMSQLSDGTNDHIEDMIPVVDAVASKDFKNKNTSTVSIERSVENSNPLYNYTDPDSQNKLSKVTFSYSGLTPAGERWLRLLEKPFGLRYDYGLSQGDSLNYYYLLTDMQPVLSINGTQVPMTESSMDELYKTDILSYLEANAQSANNIVYHAQVSGRDYWLVMNASNASAAAATDYASDGNGKAFYKDSSYLPRTLEYVLLGLAGDEKVGITYSKYQRSVSVNYAAGEVLGSQLTAANRVTSLFTAGYEADEGIRKILSTPQCEILPDGDMRITTGMDMGYFWKDRNYASKYLYLQITVPQDFDLKRNDDDTTTITVEGIADQLSPVTASTTDVPVGEETVKYNLFTIQLALDELEALQGQVPVSYTLVPKDGIAVPEGVPVVETLAVPMLTITTMGNDFVYKDYRHYRNHFIYETEMTGASYPAMGNKTMQVTAADADKVSLSATLTGVVPEGGISMETYTLHDDMSKTVLLNVLDDGTSDEENPLSQEAAKFISLDELTVTISDLTGGESRIVLTPDAGAKVYTASQNGFDVTLDYTGNMHTGFDLSVKDARKAAAVTVDYAMSFDQQQCASAAGTSGIINLKAVNEASPVLPGFTGDSGCSRATVENYHVAVSPDLVKSIVGKSDSVGCAGYGNVQYRVLAQVGPVAQDAAWLSDQLVNVFNAQRTPVDPQPEDLSNSEVLYEYEEGTPYAREAAKAFVDLLDVLDMRIYLGSGEGKQLIYSCVEGDTIADSSWAVTPATADELADLRTFDVSETGIPLDPDIFSYKIVKKDGSPIPGGTEFTAEFVLHINPQRTVTLDGKDLHWDEFEDYMGGTLLLEDQASIACVKGADGGSTGVSGMLETAAGATAKATYLFSSHVHKARTTGVDSDGREVTNWRVTEFIGTTKNALGEDRTIRFADALANIKVDFDEDSEYYPMPASLKKLIFEALNDYLTVQMKGYTYTRHFEDQPAQTVTGEVADEPGETGKVQVTYAPVEARCVYDEDINLGMFKLFDGSASDMHYWSDLTLEYETSIDWEAFFQDPRLESLPVQLLRFVSVTMSNSFEGSDRVLSDISWQTPAEFAASLTKSCKPSETVPFGTDWEIDLSVPTSELSNLVIADKMQAPTSNATSNDLYSTWDSSARSNNSCAASATRFNRFELLIDGNTVYVQNGNFTPSATTITTVNASGTSVEMGKVSFTQDGVVTQGANSFVLTLNSLPAGAKVKVLYTTALDLDKFGANHYARMKGTVYLWNSVTASAGNVLNMSAGALGETDIDSPLAIEKTRLSGDNTSADWRIEATLPDNVPMMGFRITDSVYAYLDNNAKANDYLSVTAMKVTITGPDGDTMLYDSAAGIDLLGTYGFSFAPHESSDPYFALNRNGLSSFALVWDGSKQLPLGAVVALDYTTRFDTQSFLADGNTPVSSPAVEFNNATSIQQPGYINAQDSEKWSVTPTNAAEKTGESVLNEDGSLKTMTIDGNTCQVMAWNLDADLLVLHSQEELEQFEAAGETVRVTDIVSDADLLRYVEGSGKLLTQDENGEYTVALPEDAYTVTASGRRIVVEMTKPATYPRFRFYLETASPSGQGAVSNQMVISLAGSSSYDDTDEVAIPGQQEGYILSESATGSLTLTKTDNQNSSITLPGAHFQLMVVKVKQLDGEDTSYDAVPVEGTRIVKVDHPSGYYYLYDEEAAPSEWVTDFVTNENGQIIIRDLPLDVTYILGETKAPEGYVIYPHPYRSFSPTEDEPDVSATLTNCRASINIYNKYMMPNSGRWTQVYSGNVFELWSLDENMEPVACVQRSAKSVSNDMDFDLIKPGVYALIEAETFSDYSLMTKPVYVVVSNTVFPGEDISYIFDPSKGPTFSTPRYEEAAKESLSNIWGVYLYEDKELTRKIPLSSNWQDDNGCYYYVFTQNVGSYGINAYNQQLRADSFTFAKRGEVPYMAERTTEHGVSVEKVGWVEDDLPSAHFELVGLEYPEGHISPSGYVETPVGPIITRTDELGEKCHLPGSDDWGRHYSATQGLTGGYTIDLTKLVPGTYGIREKGADKDHLGSVGQYVAYLKLESAVVCDDSGEPVKDEFGRIQRYMKVTVTDPEGNPLPTTEDGMPYIANERVSAKLSFRKVSAETGKPVEGAVFGLFMKNAQQKYLYYSYDGLNKQDVVYIGTYTLGGPYEILYSYGSSSSSKSDDYNYYRSVQDFKQLDLRKDDCIATAVSDANGMVTFSDFPMEGVNYYVKEIAAAETYVVNGDKFDVVIPDYTTGKASLATRQVDGVAEVVNNQRRLSIAKVDAETRNAVAGAKLRLTRLEGEGDEAAEVEIATWVSDGNPYEIDPDQLADGTYILYEDEAPEGYARFDPITFEINPSEDAKNTAAGAYPGITNAGSTFYGIYQVEAANSKPVSVAVEKIWDDDDDAMKLRPESITVNLYNEYPSSYVKPIRTATVTPDEDGSWVASFDDLPLYRADDPTKTCTYYAREVVPHGYKADYTAASVQVTADGENQMTITNSIRLTDVAYTKYWGEFSCRVLTEEELAKYVPLGTQIRFRLLRNGEPVEGSEQTLTIESFQYARGAGYTDLPTAMRDEDGNIVPIEYAIEELNAPEGFTPVYRMTDHQTESSCAVTNWLSRKVSVQKVWDDDDDRDGLRGEYTVQLYAQYMKSVNTDGTYNYRDPEPCGDPVTLGAETTSYTWTVPVCYGTNEANYGPVLYTVKEVMDETGAPLPGYVVLSTETSEDGSFTTITNKHEPEVTEVSVTKAWDDGNDRAEQRPESITVALLADGEEVKTFVLDADNEWQHTFTQLPRYRDQGVEIVYTVEEVLPEGQTAVKGYFPPVTTGDAAEGFTITNRYADGQLVVEGVKKIENRTFLPGDEFTFCLMKGNTQVSTVTIAPTEGNTVTFAFDPIHYTVADLGDHTYTVHEVAGKPGSMFYDAAVYTVNATVTDEGDTTLKVESTILLDEEAVEQISFLNTHYTVLDIDLTMNKVWEDAENQDGLRGEYTVQLYAQYVTGKDETGEYLYGNRQPCGEAVTLSADTLTYTWTVPDSHGTNRDDFGPVLYDIQEVLGENDEPLPGYQLVSTVVAGNGSTVITNKHEPEVTAVAVTKVWQGDEDAAGLRPESITAALLADGEELQTITLDAGNEWQHTFTQLPRYRDQGVEIVYTVEEVLPEGQTVVKGYFPPEVTGSMAEGFTITNRTAAGELTLEGTKLIENRSFAEGDSFTFRLMEGETLLESLTITPTEGESAAFAFAPIHYTVADVGEHTYTVTETAGDLPGMFYDDTVYTVKVTVADGGDTVLRVDPVLLCGDEAAEAITFTNVQYSGLTVSKTVEDGEDDSAFSFLLHLYDAQGNELTGAYDYVTETQTAGEAPLKSGDTFMLAHGQSITITGLPTGSSYTVEETADIAFETAVNGTKGSIAQGVLVSVDNTVAFVNTRKTTGFRVTKVWQGGSGPIKLTLYANGQKLDPQPSCIREGDVYYYTGLPMYDGEGKLIVYSAKEKYFDGFLTIYDNVAPYQDETKAIYHGGTIINKEIVKADFSVKKEWSGLAEGETAPGITLVLYCNGVATDIKTPKPDRNGWYRYYDLPEFAGEEPAVYTVKEEAITGFTTVYTLSDGEIADYADNGGTITNTKIPQTGDETPLALWLTLMSASAVMLMLLRKRRKA